MDKKIYDEMLENSAPILEAAVRRLSSEPAAMCYYSLLDVRPRNDDELTMRLNCRETGSSAILEYNPAWVCAINSYTILSQIIYSECLRIALHHCTLRRMEPIQFFKAASDAIVFESLPLTAGCDEKDRKLLDIFPDVYQYKALFSEKGLDPEEFYTLEKIFGLLTENMPQSQGGEGDEGEEGDSSQESEGEGSGEGSESKDGKSGSKGAKGKNKKSDGKGNSDSKDALEKYMNDAAKNTEQWGENSALDNSIQEITHHIANQGYSWGSVSGNMKQQIMTVNTPVPDPREVLRRFKMSVQSHLVEDTRMKANRRKGFDMPGFRHLMKSKVLIAIDCSGSMSDKEVSVGCEVVNRFIKHSEVDYCFWDGECGPIEKIKRQSSEFDLVGRGCTNPQCVIDKLIEEHKKYNGIVFFTDAEWVWERPEKYANNIFLISTRSENPTDWIRYYLNMKDIIEISKD